MGRGPTTVHPTQRRFSCQVCRKHKSRCRRLHVNDTKCARCTLLGVECVAGQQKIVGRPRRRGAASANETRQTTPDSPGSTLPIPPTPPTEGHHNQPKQLGIHVSHEGSSFVEERSEPDWSSMVSPAAAPVPMLPTAAQDAFITAQTWPVVGAGSFDQDRISWETSDPYQIFSLSNTDSGFGITATFNTPVITSLPIDSIYYTPTEPPVIPGPGQVPTNDLGTSDAFTKLSKINLDVHLRVAVVDRERANLHFNTFVYREGPLYIDSSTFAEFMLRASQDFALILNRLLSSRPKTYGLSRGPPDTTRTFSELLSLSPESFQQNHSNPTSTRPSFYYPAAPLEPLLSPLALTLTSIFTQLISLYELMLDQLTARIKRVAIEPVDPFPGLTFGGVSVAEPCVQGMLFSEVVTLLLERIEQALGVSAVPESSEAGLLSSRQKYVLWSELDGGFGIIPGHGITRPANVRKRFKTVAFSLKQVSLGNH